MSVTIWQRKRLLKLAESHPEQLEQLLARGNELIEGFSQPVTTETDFQALTIERWLNDLKLCADETDDKQALQQLQQLLVKVKQAVAQAQTTTKEKLLQAKRGSKGKQAYQQQK
jgi:hypothetical protein